MTTAGKQLMGAGAIICFAMANDPAASDDFCRDNLDAAVGSLRAARLELGELGNAEGEELCDDLQRYVDVTKAARIIFGRCLTGAFREEMLQDADASIADIGGAFPVLCGE